ncbi:MAG: tRNA preQ1(34) S-adenosylmethionine ribosyltransferase-isomerase QueA [Phycisphaerales bacterium]
MLRTAELDYDLPEASIARMPAPERDAARLMVVKRSDPGFLRHATVRDIPTWLHAGDCLVVNHSRVLPARFQGQRSDTGGKVEGLFLSEPGPGRWRVLLQGKRMKPGVAVTMAGRDGAPSEFSLLLKDRLPDEPGGWWVDVQPARPAMEVLDRTGLTPIPPYIRRAREHAAQAVPDEDDRARYQTVFASRDAEAAAPDSPDRVCGSVAAPTAGLHLTPSLLGSLDRMGVHRGDVSLHVGTGTFRTVDTEFVEQHEMHAEWCSMPQATRQLITTTRQAGARVVCVGTTSARTVESYAHAAEHPAWLSTRILITPGYQWKWTDGLLTNFHLPRSTLMAMVAALLGDSGAERLKTLYAAAIAQGYRFYSYGDAMLVLP